MPDATKISKSIRDRLMIEDPELSTALGTPVRKVIDATADVVSELSFDSQFEFYRFDLNAYSGSDLDEFVALFGFQRQKATAATGTITIERDNADVLVTVGVNAQFYKSATSSTRSVFFASSGYAIMEVGQTTAEIPVRAVLPGSEGNVPANTITGFEGAVTASRCYNLLATTGGLDDESDEQLRARFKATVFRNVAGTKDQYMGLALAHALVSRANLIGQVSFWSEIVTMVDPGAGEPQADSTNAEVEVLLDDTHGVWLYDIEGVDHAGSPSFYVQGVNYDFLASEALGVVTFEGTAGSITDGAICRMEYEYLSSVNRNDSSGVHPRAVELIVDGEDGVTVLAEAVLDVSTVFDNTGGEMDKDNWIRLDDSTTPVATNVYVPLPFQPAMSLPDAIDFGGGTTLIEGTNYWLVRDVSKWRGSVRSRDGIEFVAADVAALDGAQFSLSYQYNRVPRAIQDLIERHRQVPADALVHAAKERNFAPQLLVMYSVFPTSAVDALVEDALENFFNTMPLGSWIQLPDIEKVVHNVGGVDSVRLVNSTDGYANYGVLEYATDGTTELAVSPHTNDIKLRSDEVPVLHSVTIINRTQEQWV